MKNILLIGGMGYIGSIITNYFLNKKYKVHVLDNVIYKQNYVLNSFINHKNFFFYRLDLSKVDKIKNLIIENEIKNIVLLAGLVGDPITKKYKKLSIENNEKKILYFISKLKKYYSERFIFISTCSNYGLSKKNVVLDENSLLKPLSLYAKSKVKIEKYLIKNNFLFDFCILRFATAFGASYRMRYDLTVNEFTKELYLNKIVDIYDYDTWRPYCHVYDFASIIFKILNIEKKKFNKQIYNCGSDKNNISKKKLGEIISKKVNGSKINLLDFSKDRRNYVVNFTKIKKAIGNHRFKSIDYGITEIIKLLDSNIDDSLFMNGNYELFK